MALFNKVRKSEIIIEYYIILQCIITVYIYKLSYINDSQKHLPFPECLQLNFNFQKSRKFAMNFHPSWSA